MATKHELNQYYFNLYGKNFASSTLSKWRKEGRIKSTIIPKSQRKGAELYDYDLESFKNAIQESQYIDKLRASKEDPKNYIGKFSGSLEIIGIVPENEKKYPNFKGTMMYCKCHKCNKPDLIQVRFSYLTPNGNYHQLTCGCGRKERAFLATARNGITEEFLSHYEDNFEYFLFLHKFITGSVTDGYYVRCDIKEYEQAIRYFEQDPQFIAIYTFWQQCTKNNTYYDWAKPSLDHIIPKSKGGTNELSNLQALTVFENLAKRDMTMDEWNKFKQETNTHSEYFIENIMKGGKDI